MDTDTLPERMRSRIDKEGPIPAHAPELGACWLWTGARTKGYGKVFFQGQMRVAHRVVYTLLVREPTATEDLDHLCRNRPCCNPAHVEPVTHAENVMRGWALVTHCKRGHPRTPENRRKSLGKECRLCVNLRQNAKYANDPAWREKRQKAERERQRAKASNRNNQTTTS